MLQKNQDMEVEKRIANAREKIKAYMQKIETMEKKFNPFHNFGLQSIVAILAPQVYTKEELATLKKLNQIVLQETRLSLDNNKKRCMAYAAERRVKPKTTKKMKPKGCMAYAAERRAKPKTKKKMEPKKQDKENLSSPILPIHVENKIKELNGTDIRYIMRKELFSSDLREDQNRLLMTVKEDKNDFLTEIEKETLDRRDEKNKLVGLEVIVLDPYFRSFTMSLRKWNMGINRVYSLVKDWKLVFRKNSFEIGQELNIWSFRVNNKLHFVLHNIHQA